MRVQFGRFMSPESSLIPSRAGRFYRPCAYVSKLMNDVDDQYYKHPVGHMHRLQKPSWIHGLEGQRWSRSSPSRAQYLGTSSELGNLPNRELPCWELPNREQEPSYSNKRWDPIPTTSWNSKNGRDVALEWIRCKFIMSLQALEWRFHHVDPACHWGFSSSVTVMAAWRISIVNDECVNGVPEYVVRQGRKCAKPRNRRETLITLSIFCPIIWPYTNPQ